MTHVKKYKVVNTANPTRVHGSVTEFYSFCDNPDDAIALHMNNDTAWHTVRSAVLSSDGTYVTQTYGWHNETVYNQWLSAKNALALIDQDLTITEV
jgi:hypothetical protein